MQQNDSESDASNDVVILGGGAYYEEIKWRFPQTKKCPHFRCNKIFPSREETIKHYQVKHARNATFCKTCDKPVSYQNFEEHKKSSSHRLSLTTSKTMCTSAPVNLFLYCWMLQSFEFDCFLLYSNQNISQK